MLTHKRQLIFKREFAPPRRKMDATLFCKKHVANCNSMYVILINVFILQQTVGVTDACNPDRNSYNPLGTTTETDSFSVFCSLRKILWKRLPLGPRK